MMGPRGAATGPARCRRWQRWHKVLAPTRVAQLRQIRADVVGAAETLWVLNADKGCALEAILVEVEIHIAGCRVEVQGEVDGFDGCAAPLHLVGEIHAAVQGRVEHRRVSHGGHPGQCQVVGLAKGVLHRPHAGTCVRVAHVEEQRPVVRHVPTKLRVADGGPAVMGRRLQRQELAVKPPSLQDRPPVHKLGHEADRRHAEGKPMQPQPVVGQKGSRHPTADNAGGPQHVHRCPNGAGRREEKMDGVQGHEVQAGQEREARQGHDRVADAVDKCLVADNDQHQLQRQGEDAQRGLPDHGRPTARAPRGARSAHGATADGRGLGGEEPAPLAAGTGRRCEPEGRDHMGTGG